MKESSGVEAKPILFYDGECPFCRSAAIHWESRAGGKVDVVPVQSGAGVEYGIPAEGSLAAVTLVEGRDRVHLGAAAVFRLMNLQGSRVGNVLWRLYREAGWFRWLSDRGYSLVATHRFMIRIR